MLEKIGIRFNTVNVEYLWKQNYNLAKAYYEKYGNLEIPQRFKTTNGYDYDQDGFSLGYWIGTQRKMYKKNKLSEDRTKKLEKIGMRFDILSLEDLWMQNYNLAKAYYERYGNLEISQIFKTTNGYDYDENGILLRNWIMTQKQAYKGQTDCVLNDTKIKLLDDIHIIWFLPSTDLKLQSEIITEKNTLQKQKEILNRFRTYLNSLDSSKLVDKKEINNGFIKQLNIKND